MRRLGGLLLAGFLAIAAAAPAAAHPHVWVESRVVLVEDQGRLAVELEWSFDRDFSDFVLTRFKKGKGIGFSDAEQLEIRRKAFGNLKEYNYFVSARWDGGEAQEFAGETAFHAWVQGDIVVYRFRLPLADPPRPDARLSIAVYDPEYFVAIAPSPRDPVLSRTARLACALTTAQAVSTPWGDIHPPTTACQRG